MTETEKNEEKKIIVDEDWKAEAKRDKEILVAAEEAEKEAEKETAPEEAEQRRGPMPAGNLSALISMLATQAMFALGLLQVKGQDERKVDLELAKYNIDMLETIEEKTKGNLSEAEEQILTKTLSELRMGYVEVADQAGSESPSE